MMINGVGGGNSSYAPKPSGGGEVAQLEQQKKAIQNEIKRVQGDDKLKPDAKEQKLDMLEKKLQKIEEAIQKASADSSQESQGKTSASVKTAEELQQQSGEDSFGETGNLLNRYA